jgi:transposase
MRFVPISQSSGSAPVGRNGVEELLRVVADPGDKRVPNVARAYLALGAQFRVLKA